MTDDTSETHVIVQRQLAQGEGLGYKMAATNQPLGESTPTQIDLPPKISEATATCTMLIPGTAQNLNGQWQEINIKYLTRFTDNKVALNTERCISGIQLNHFMGIADISVYKSTINKNYLPVYSGDNIRKFKFFKLNSIKAEFRNFAVYIERDASGGIQMMDDIVFAVRRRFVSQKYATQDKVKEPLYEHPVEYTMTDLKNGLSTELSVTQMGWLEASDLVVQGAGKWYDYNYLDSLIAQDVTDPTTTFHSKVWLNNPDYYWEIKALNMPIVSNTKFWLTFTIQLTGNWTVKGRFATDQDNEALPYPGETFSLTKYPFIPEKKESKTQENAGQIQTLTTLYHQMDKSLATMSQRITELKDNKARGHK